MLRSRERHRVEINRQFPLLISVCAKARRMMIRLKKQKVFFNFGLRNTESWI